jgi:hypothetical protein
MIIFQSIIARQKTLVAVGQQLSQKKTGDERLEKAEWSGGRKETVFV